MNTLPACSTYRASDMSASQRQDRQPSLAQGTSTCQIWHGRVRVRRCQTLLLEAGLLCNDPEVALLLGPGRCMSWLYAQVALT